MARPGRAADEVGTSLRLPRALLDRIDQAADERDVSRNWIIRKLIEEGMDRLVPVADLTLLRPVADPVPPPVPPGLPSPDR